MTLAQDRSQDRVSAAPPPALPSTAPYFRAPAKSRLPLIIATLLVAAAAGTYYYLHNSGPANDATVLTFPVALDSFDVRIPLNGELKASRSVEIRSQVEGQTTILSLVPEGSRVSEGEILITLASDTIKDKLEESRIRLDNAIAAAVNSEEGVHIQEMQNESDIKTGETTAEIARLEFEQFVQGDSKVQIDTFTTALENAKTDLERKTKELTLTKELAAQQFVSDNDVLDAVIAERDSRNKLHTAEMNLQVWNLYGDPTKRQTLERKKEAAIAELERTKAKASSNLLLKQADLRAKQSSQRVEETRFKGFQEQLDACTIKAPQSGMVVYESSSSGYYGEGPIDKGATVRQNQTLIELPDTSKMLVQVHLPEQLTDKVKRGLEAVVTIDAVPGKVFHGHVNEIAMLPDSSNRWANPNLKEYLTTIMLEDLDTPLKPGMSSKVDILVQHVNDVLTVPLQAVFFSGGQRYAYVGTAEHYQRRDIVVGQTNSSKAEIISGLKLGETVLLSRPKDAPAEQLRPADPAKDKDAKDTADKTTPIPVPRTGA